MQQPQASIDYLALLRRRIHWLIWPALLIFLTAAAVALLLPNVYKSETTILIEGRQIAEGLVTSTVTTYADQRIQAIKQEVMSRSKLLELVEKFDLYPELREKISTDALVNKVKSSISIEPLSAAVKTGRSDRATSVTIAFTLSFEGENPGKIQGVVNDLTSFFLAKNLKARQASARGTTDFLEKQAEKVRETVTELNEKVAKFKEAHLEELPEFMTLNLKKVEKINDRINNIDREILTLREQRASVKYRIGFVNPYSGTGGRVLTDEEKLQQLELNRAELKSKYSEKHPKVKALEKEIAMLKETVTQFQDLRDKRTRLNEREQYVAQLRSRYSDKHPLVKKAKLEIEELQKEIATTESNRNGATETDDVDMRNVTNPAYINLRSELDRITIRLSSRENEKKELMEEEEQIYAKLKTMPDVEKRYRDILVDRDQAKRSLSELQNKLQVARVAEGMEEGQLGENFAVTEPAYLPEDPFKPNRLAIMLLGLIFGVGAGVGMGALKEYTDHSIRLPEEIEKLTGHAVLAIIPSIQTPKERRKKMVTFAYITLLTCTVLATGITLFHLLVMDLYIFYDKMLKFLGDRLLIHF
ncbi:MAG: GumC family protein [Desulfobacterales bacterium]